MHTSIHQHFQQIYPNLVAFLKNKQCLSYVIVALNEVNYSPWRNFCVELKFSY